MAADSRVCRNEVILSDDGCKIHRLADGSLIGAAGVTPHVAAYREWLNTGRSGARPPLKLDDVYSTIFQVHPGGRMELHDYCGSYFLPADVMFSTGSGRDFALAAMDMGATAEDAVRVAMKRDPFTGGKIKTLQLLTERDPLNPKPPHTPAP